MIIFEHYLAADLGAGESKRIQCAVKDSPDFKTWGSRLVEIPSDYDMIKENIPQWFNICCDDIDGDSMFQTFDYHNSFDEDYYLLSNTEYTEVN